MTNAVPPALARASTRAAAGRIAIGAAAVLCPGPSSRLLGYPQEQDSPTARLMARLFGVRDIALGALVLRTRQDASLARYVFKLNAWCDAGDLAAMTVAVVGRQGIDRAAVTSAGFAVFGGTTWFRLIRATGPA